MCLTFGMALWAITLIRYHSLVNAIEAGIQGLMVGFLLCAFAVWIVRKLK